MGCGASTKYVEQDQHTTKVHPRRLSKSKAGVEFPEYWSCDGNATVLPFRTHVDDSEEDRIFVQALIEATIEAGSPQILVERVVRVEDSKMWSTYERSITHLAEIRRETDEPWEIKSPVSKSLQNEPLTRSRLPGVFMPRLRMLANETYLWHGTDRASAEKIILEDFDMKLAGNAHAQILGRGAYFAESCSIADKYAPAAATDGLHTLLLVRAALGKVYVTKKYTGWRGHKLVRTVSTSKVVRAGRYDSVLGDRKIAFNDCPVREYCVANKSQLYPEYMVLYRRDPEDLPSTSKSSNNKSVGSSSR